jgi:hypothetical protein
MSGLLHDLCKAKLAIDKFYESQNDGIIYDIPDSYLRAERCLNEAISSLSEYVGMYLTEEYLKPAGNE